MPGAPPARKDATPVRQQWSYVLLALTHRYDHPEPIVVNQMSKWMTCLNKKKVP